MNAQLFATFTPTTLAAMAADLSQFLADEYDTMTVDSRQWDALAEQLAAIVDALAALDDDYMALLMDAGADPDVIFEGAPA